MTNDQLIKVYQRANELQDYITKLANVKKAGGASVSELRLKMLRDTFNLNSQILLKFEAANRLNQDGIILTQ